MRGDRVCAVEQEEESPTADVKVPPSETPADGVTAFGTATVGDSDGWRDG